MLNIVIFGAPGSGKGTQSEKIVEKYHVTHISTGEVLRQEIENRSDLGKLADKYMSQGQLVPDNYVIKMLDEFLDKKKKNVGNIFDGFPRTLMQGIALDEILENKNNEIKIVISLEVEDNVLIDRLIKRGEVSGRNDDTPETIKSRLQVYYEQTAQLKDFYAKQGKLIKIDGVGTVDTVFSRIEEEIDQLEY